MSDMGNESNSWVGVDLDSTLAVHNRGDGIDKIGAPIPRMVKYIREKYLDKGIEVRIMTARVGGKDSDQIAEQVAMIENWTRQVFGRPLKVTAAKDMKMLKIYDDKAQQVIPNTGILV